jgi:hypothetical protein
MGQKSDLEQKEPRAADNDEKLIAVIIPSAGAFCSFCSARDYYHFVSSNYCSRSSLSSPTSISRLCARYRILHFARALKISAYTYTLLMRSAITIYIYSCVLCTLFLFLAKMKLADDARANAGF